MNTWGYEKIFIKYKNLNKMKTQIKSGKRGYHIYIKNESGKLF